MLKRSNMQLQKGCSPEEQIWSHGIVSSTKNRNVIVLNYCRRTSSVLRAAVAGSVSHVLV